MKFANSIILFMAVIHMPNLTAQRIPTIDPNDYSAEQMQAAAEFEAARNRPVSGPFELMMHSPAVMSRARAFGDYLRFNSAIGNTLSELAILITAREWTQDYEWYAHYPIALEVGIDQEIADAIAEGRRPAGMSEDEEIVYDFSIELHRNRRVSDVTFQRALERFGNKGVIDLTGISGSHISGHADEHGPVSGPGRRGKTAALPGLTDRATSVAHIPVLLAHTAFPAWLIETCSMRQI